LWFVGQPPGFDEAERLYQEALRTYAHTVGEERANLARAMQSFAFMRLTQGRPADAELLFRRSLDIARRLLGDDHQFTIEGLGGLSDAVRQQGNYAEAEALLQEVIRHVPRLYGEERVPFFLRQLAEAQSEGGSYVAAEESYRALLARLCRQYSQREPSASLELERVANQLEFPSANQDASEGLIAFLKLHGAGAIPADVLGPGIEYAAHLRRRGDFATARATLEAMRGIAAPLRGTRWRGEVEMAFGALFDALNQSADAAKHLELAHMLFSEDVGKNHRRTLDAAKKMADLRGPAAAAQG
jgi:tetratricopeptide (TPR) repeat protein